MFKITLSRSLPAALFTLSCSLASQAGPADMSFFVTSQGMGKGADLGAGDFDSDASFNSTFSDWYLGTDGATPPGKWDLMSVVLHELGHGRQRLVDRVHGLLLIICGVSRNEDAAGLNPAKAAAAHFRSGDPDQHSRPGVATQGSLE